MNENVTDSRNLFARLFDGLKQPEIINWMVGASALVLFIASSVRHSLFQSGALDLGYFDQAIYLISQGQVPVVSFWGYHFLGGHADWMVYPLALLYWLHPDVHWLFAVQAIALAIGALPTYHLTRQAGLKESQSVAMAAAYLLYPLVFNLNLFDFHPEVMALPLMLAAVLAARANQVGWFTLATVLALGCRDGLSPTIAAMGFWLLVFEKRRLCGAIALIAGIAWFLIAIKLVIPAFRPGGVESVLRYAYLGNSVLDIAKNLVLKPHLVLGRVFSLQTLEYLALLLAPLLWGLHPRHLAPLVAAIPMLVINLLSDSSAQRNLVHQYSLPIVPFLLLAAIAALAANKAWISSRRAIILWSLVTFLALAKFGYFWSRYLESVDNLSATWAAIAQVQSKGSVLTNPNIVSHLTHRPQIRYTITEAPPSDLNQYEYVLLNTRHPGWVNTPAFAMDLVNQLQTNPRFQLHFQQDDVYLFKRDR